MRIGIDTITSRFGGARTYIINLIAELSKIDKVNEYLLFVAPDKKEEYYVPQSNFQTVICEFPARSLFHRLLWEQISLRKIIKENEIDVMYFPVNNCTLYAPCKRVLAVRYTTVFDNLTPKKYWKTWLTVWMMRKATELSVKVAERVIFVSKTAREHLLPFLKIPIERTAVIYHGRNENFRKLPLSEIEETVKNKYKIDSEYILSVSDIYVHKNFTSLIKAFDDFQRKHGKTFKLVIAGKIVHHWYYEQMIQLIHQLGIESDVMLLGGVPYNDMPALYSGAKVFVFPSSSSETFGHPLVEAMSCGCPIVASNTSCIPEIVQEAAFLMNPWNIEEMSAAIYKAISDGSLRESLIQKGYERVNDFSWRKCAQETLRVFEEVYNS